VYGRPHDIEVTAHEPGTTGVPAILRHVHTAGAQERLTFEVVATREQIDGEIGRSELADLGLRLNDLTLLRLRPAHSFQVYAI